MPLSKLTNTTDSTRISPVIFNTWNFAAKKLTSVDRRTEHPDFLKACTFSSQRSRFWFQIHSHSDNCDSVLPQLFQWNQWRCLTGRKNNMYTANQTTKKAMTMRRKRDLIISGAKNMLVLFELFSDIIKIFWIVHGNKTTILLFSMDSHRNTRYWAMSIPPIHDLP